MSSKLSPVLRLLYPAGAYIDQARMAGPAQAGENFPVQKRGKELIASYGCVLGRRFGIDGVHVQPRAPYGENVLGHGAAVGAGGKVDVDLGGSDLPGGRLGRILLGLARRARNRRKLLLVNHGNSVSQLGVLDG